MEFPTDFFLDDDWKTTKTSVFPGVVVEVMKTQSRISPGTRAIVFYLYKIRYEMPQSDGINPYIVDFSYYHYL